jgi:hypothetical protein
LKLDSNNLLRIVKILVVLVLIALSLVIFMRSMAQPVVDPEHVSCTAGVLLTKGKMIYRDFACVAQMPYHPFLCAAIYKALNTTHYLFAARMLTVVCDILIIISIIGIFHRVFASFPNTGWLFGMAMAVLYVFNCHVDEVNGFALNLDFMILCILVSFWLFISTDFKRRSRYLRIGAMSILLTLATCLHVTAVFIQLLFFVMLLIQHAESGRQRLKTALPFLIAPAVILILPIWTMVQTPRAFFINIFEMPILRMQLIRKTQLMMGATVFGKFTRILTYLTIPRGIFPFLIAICLIVLIMLGRRKLKISNLTNALHTILVPVIFLIIILCSPEVLYENCAILVPFIIISFAYPLLYLRRLETSNPHRLFRIASIVVIACTFSQVASQPFLLLRISKIFRPQSWIPMRLHQISDEIAQKAREPKLVATLAPLYALESGCDIYPELSSGWAGSKIASIMSDSKREITNTLSVETFKEMLEERPPSAVIIDIVPGKVQVSRVGLVLLRIGKTQWPEQDYDESIWERKEYPFDVVIYFRL